MVRALPFNNLHLLLPRQRRCMLQLVFPGLLRSVGKFEAVRESNILAVTCGDPYWSR